MSKRKKEYKRLPGKKRGLVLCNTLWAGEDHLLAVESVFFSENYKRFYYNDIQAVVIRKTIEGKVQNAILGGTAAVFILMDLLSDQSMPFLMAIGGAGLILVLISMMRGPTCECRIQTAVQVEKLPSLYRLKVARKVMARLMPVIGNVQGILPAEALTDESLMAQAENIRPRPSEKPPGSALSTPAIQRPGPRTVHHLLFVLLLVHGVSGLIDLFWNHVGITLLVTALTMSLIVCVIIALIRQYDSAMGSMLRGITWTVLGFLCVELLAGYVFFFVIAFRNPGVIHSRWEMIQLISNLSPLENPVLAGYYIFSICAALVLGIAGLMLVKR